MSAGRLCLIALCLAPRVLDAQGAESSEVASPASPAAATVRAIEITRRDIFDPSEDHWLARMANRLHVTTQAPVVRRELLFEVGEPYDSARVAETERNLRALGVFRRVQIDTAVTDSGVVVRVITKDGWSTKPDWRWRSAGGEVAFTIGLIEDNFLGTATGLALRYSKNPDRSSVVLGFRRSRLFANAIGVGVQYENRSDGRIAYLGVDRPFFSLTSPYGFRVDLENREERILRFRNGNPAPATTLQRRYVLGRASAAVALRANPHGFLRLGLTAQVRRDDYAPDSTDPVFARTVTAAVGPYLTWNRADFLVTSGVSGFAREEDVDLGTTLRAGFLVAPALFGYERDGIGPQVAARVGRRLPGGFAYVDAVANGLFTSAGLDSGSVRVAGTMVLQPGRRHLAIFHLESGWQRAPQPGGEFDLGLGAGPRAFRSHAFTGDRMVFGTAEYRWTATENLWSLVGVGIAGFVDYGGAWYSGSRRRTGWDAGVGLRIGASRSSETESLRFDLARRFATDTDPGEWVMVVGKGFLFAPLVR